MPRATTRRDADRRTLTQQAIEARTRRRLDELERTNASVHNEPDSDPESFSKFRARQTVISDKRSFPAVNAAKKKKSTMNVRTAILYRKGLAALIDESGIASLPLSYLTAGAPPSGVPPRMLCSVCGFRASYRCKKCALAYCDARCGHVHDETRCERRVV